MPFRELPFNSWSSASSNLNECREAKDISDHPTAMVLEIYLYYSSNTQFFLLFFLIFNSFKLICIGHLVLLMNIFSHLKKSYKIFWLLQFGLISEVMVGCPDHILRHTIAVYTIGWHISAGSQGRSALIFRNTVPLRSCKWDTCRYFHHVSERKRQSYLGNESMNLSINLSNCEVLIFLTCCSGNAKDATHWIPLVLYVVSFLNHYKKRYWKFTVWKRTLAQNWEIDGYLSRGRLTNQHPLR